MGEPRHGPGRILVTGATGWLGMAMLDALLERLGPEAFRRRVVPLASSARPLPLSPALPDLATLPLAMARELGGVGQLLHCAFLTRDRLTAIGPEAYLRGNREILAALAALLERNPECRLVSISSGAAAAHDGRGPLGAADLERDPYGVLKQQEEALALAHANALVLRPYAVGGRRIRGPERFALGSFLLQALRGEAIRIEARRPVRRSFVDSADLARAAVHWALEGGPSPGRPLAACTLTTDLLALAERITALHALPPVRHAIDPAAEPHDYTADPAPFRALLSGQGSPPGSLDRLLAETAAGIAAAESPS